MPDLTFDRKNRADFPTRYHGQVSISKEKWDEICQEPERFYYRENAEKLATTLINPDYVRHHRIYDNQLIYYKKFDVIKIGGKETEARINYWAVVIDIATKRICTVFPTQKPKKGREYKGGES